MINKQIIYLGFEGQQYVCELPVEVGFTGSMVLAFHWKDGKLLKTQASKTASAEIVDKPIDNIEKVLINNDIKIDNT